MAEMEAGDLSNLDKPVGSLPGENKTSPRANAVTGSPGAVGSGVVHMQLDTSDDGPGELTLPEQDSGYVAHMLNPRRESDLATQTPVETLGKEEKRSFIN